METVCAACVQSKCVFPLERYKIMSIHGVGSESVSHSETGDTSRDLRDVLYERLVNDGQLAHIKVSGVRAPGCTLSCTGAASTCRL